MATGSIVSVWHGALARFKAAPVRDHLQAVLLVEYRDEVFARLEADLAAGGFRVARAADPQEAWRQYARLKPEFVVANVDLPGESGWLLCGKIRLLYPDARLWLYTPRLSGFDQGLASFLGVAEVISYHGDLFDLADELLERLCCRQTGPIADDTLGSDRVATGEVKSVQGVS